MSMDDFSTFKLHAGTDSFCKLQITWRALKEEHPSKTTQPQDQVGEQE